MKKKIHKELVKEYEPYFNDKKITVTTNMMQANTAKKFDIQNAVNNAKSGRIASKKAVEQLNIGEFFL